MRSLSIELKRQLFGQESNDPFLMLITLTHSSFDTIRLVNDVEDVVSRGETFMAFPVAINMPTDDGETIREVKLVIDNATLELIDELRSVTTPISVKLETILASIPDTVQIELDNLKLLNIQYNRQTISGNLYLDDFLSTEMFSEKYTPTNFPGIF